MTLSEQQRLFVKLIAQFILWAYDQGYEFTFGWAERPEWVAEIYAKQGKGIRNSLHTQRLAVDLNLFINGNYTTSEADYKPLGEKWETMHPLCRWGGRFSDGNHFSMEYGGRK
jgi:hypothetical protein